MVATIHIIPACAARGDVERHLQALRRAVVEGEDLGVRGPHIRALGASLDLLLIALRQQRDEVLAAPETGSPGVERMAEQMRELESRLAPLVRLARTYPA